MSRRGSTMHRAGIAAGIGALVAAGALAAAALWLDAQAIADAIATRMAARSGWQVEIDSAHTSWLPVPSVRLEGVRLRSAEGQDAFLSARRVALRVAWLPLLAGRVALRSLEMEAPHLRLARGPDGALALPPSAPREGDGEIHGDSLRVWITALAIREGVVEIGPHRIEGIDAEGSARLDGSADLAFAGDWVGVGAIRDGRLDVAELARNPVWSAHWDLLDVDLAALGDGPAAIPGLRAQGLAQARMQLAGHGSDLTQAGVRAALHSLRWHGRDLRIDGEAALSAELGGAWTLDLAGARIEAGSAVRKPVGLPARIGGRLPDEPKAVAAAIGDDLWLEIGRSALRGSARWDDYTAVSLGGVVELADAREWLSMPSLPGEGRLVIDELTYAPSLATAGHGRLENVVLALGEDLRVALSGPVFLHDATLGSDGLAATVLGETFRVEGAIDLASAAFDAGIQAREGVELTRVWQALETEERISGRAYGHLDLRGLLDGSDLRGTGELEVQNGEMVHVSLERLATARVQPASRERYPFRRLLARFELAEGTLSFSRLDLDQADASAELRGSLTLADQNVDLVGEARFFVGPDFVPIPFRLSGPLRSFKASFDVTSPAEEEAGRRGRRQLLEGMLELLAARSRPEDPVEARALREQIEHVETALRALRQEERAARLVPGSRSAS